MIQKSFVSLYMAQEDFELLNDTASEEQRALWQTQLDNAMDSRVSRVEAMDVLNVSIDKGKGKAVSLHLASVCLTHFRSSAPSRARVQHDLIEAELDNASELGVTSWLALGMKIQESQCAICFLIY